MGSFNVGNLCLNEFSFFAFLSVLNIFTISTENCINLLIEIICCGKSMSVCISSFARVGLCVLYYIAIALTPNICLRSYSEESY